MMSIRTAAALTSLFALAVTVSSNIHGANKIVTLPLKKKILYPSDSAPGKYRARRRASSLGKPQELVALYQDDGEHYVDLWCGTPPQRVTLLVVTGVAPGLSGFPCSDCVGECGKYHHVDSVYQDQDSETFRVLQCDECLSGICSGNSNKCKTGTSYPSGDFWNGYEVTDKCYMGGPHDEPLALPDWEAIDDVDPNAASAFAFDFVFSCQARLTGVFNTFLADGILSMDNTMGSFWGQMYRAGRIPERKFSMCYRRAREFNSSGTHAGAMTMGGVDTRLHTSDMVMSKMDPSGSNYMVKMRKIHLRAGGGGDSAKSERASSTVKTIAARQQDYEAFPIYLDSGYTNTHLSSDIINAFYDTWKELTSNTYSTYPKSMSLVERDSLPTILFQFVGDEAFNQALMTKNGLSSNGVAGLAGDLDPDHPLDVIVAVPPSHYMALVGGTTNRYKATIYESRTREGSASVLGANVMRGHDILFDVEDERLGWAESSCDYADLVEGYYNGTYGDIPWSKKSKEVGKSQSKGDPKRSGMCSSGFCRGTFLLLLVAGGVFVYVVQNNNASSQLSYVNRRRPVIYQDYPNELELRARDDDNEITFYDPPRSEAFQGDRKN